jgi:hypothetical protein
MENRFIQKIPLNPPLPRWEDTGKDSRQAGMTTEKCPGSEGVFFLHTLFICINGSSTPKKVF